MTTPPDDETPDPEARGGAGVGARAIPRSAHAPLGVLALVSLWTVMAAVNPDVTYHLAPAVIAWSVPYLAETACTLRRVMAAAGGGFVAVLRGLGWLEGPVLFGGDAFGEAVWVAAAATLVAIDVGLARQSRQPAHGTESP